MPAPILLKTPSVFAPHDIDQIEKFLVSDLRRAGMYTSKQLKTFFRDNVIHKTASALILKKK